MHHDMPTSASTDPTTTNVTAFMERLRRHTETTASSLKSIYEKEGNSPTFQEALDDVVFEVAFEDPEYAANAEKLKNSKLSKEEGERISKQQQATAAQIRRLIMQEANLNVEEAGTDIEIAQAAVAKRLEGMDLGRVESDDILRKLGILKEDKNGAVFTYPDELLPESVNDKWNIYLSSVANHIEKGNKVRRGELPRTELEDADRMRRFAHNRITSDLDEIFGFKALPEAEWDFEKTRKLVAKMVESKFIGTPTSESVVTSQALARGFGRIGLGVLNQLSQGK